MECILLIANNNSVSSVIATLIAHYIINAIAKDVGSFTLALIAPLSSQQN
jgi:hypothetical protein